MVQMHIGECTFVFNTVVTVLCIFPCMSVNVITILSVDCISHCFGTKIILSFVEKQKHKTGKINNMHLNDFCATMSDLLKAGMPN